MVKGWRLALLVLLSGALIGLSIFLTLALRAVDVETIDAATAAQRIDQVRVTFGDARPLVTLDRNDRPHPGRRPAAAPAVKAAATLHVLAYRAGERRLVSAEVPLWFLDLKEPVVRAAMKPTGIDLHALGLTAAQLKREGRALVLEVEKANGDRALVWTD